MATANGIRANRSTTTSGTDGLGPFDAGYPGPDPDGTEGNGKPEQGEPNFGILDKDESDQLGLTGFLISAVHTYDLNNDERNWTALSSRCLPRPTSSRRSMDVNLANHFSSYMFHLYGRNTYSAATGQIAANRRDRAVLHGADLRAGHRRSLPAEADRPADLQCQVPVRQAARQADREGGCGRRPSHACTGTDRAEQTFDAFYQKYNFEGYRVYRSTEANFLETQIITDAYGKPTFRKPIAQFDLVDGVMGLHPIDVNGAQFYLGDDSGLQHAFIDSTVQNGQTYYYAVTAVRPGVSRRTSPDGRFGIPPVGDDEHHQGRRQWTGDQSRCQHCCGHTACAGRRVYHPAGDRRRRDRAGNGECRGEDHRPGFASATITTSGWSSSIRRRSTTTPTRTTVSSIRRRVTR